MDAFIGGRFGRAFGALLLAVLASFSLPGFFALDAAARDPDWYSDVQYLTWNDSMAGPGDGEPELGPPSGEVQIEAPDPDAICDECESCDACGDGWCQPTAASDWQARIECLCKKMAASGVAYEVVVPQFYQGVTHGGIDRGFEYGGKVDQFLTLDSTKLGLWEGMTMSLHAESRYGEDVNFEAVGLAPVNVAMLYPDANEHVTAITNLSFAQALNEDVQVTFGKFNALDMFYMLYPETGRGVNGFMQTSIVIPLALARVFPLSFMGAGVLKLNEGRPQGSLTVYDPQDVSTTSGFENLGDNGVNIMGFYRFFTEVGGLPGSVGFGMVGATGTFVAFESGGFIIVPNEGVVLPTQNGSWAVFYIQQQTLWADQCNPERKIGLLSQWCLADEHTCPFTWTANVALQGHGLVAGRPNDTIGAGFFYNGVSDEFKALLAPVRDLHDLNGVELFYNAQVAKSFAVTADLQVIEPAEQSFNTAVVFGLRGVVGF